MIDLRPCVECRRHVAIDERSCPFCGAALSVGSPHEPLLGRLSRAAVFAGAALAGTACGGKKAQPQNVDQQQAQADAGVVEDQQKVPEKVPEPMPYGAPPARRRVV